MKAILLIDMPEYCKRCPCADLEYYVCNLTCNAFLSTRDSDCPLIPLTEYEEARIKELLKERENGTQQDMPKIHEVEREISRNDPT